MVIPWESWTNKMQSLRGIGMTFLRSLIFIVMFASFHFSLSVTSYNPIPNNATALWNNLSMCGIKWKTLVRILKKIPFHSIFFTFIIHIPLYILPSFSMWGQLQTFFFCNPYKKNTFSYLIIKVPPLLTSLLCQKVTIHAQNVNQLGLGHDWEKAHSANPPRAGSGLSPIGSEPKGCCIRLFYPLHKGTSCYGVITHIYLHYFLCPAIMSFQILQGLYFPSASPP